jgi:hypothetical protein
VSLGSITTISVYHILQHQYSKQYIPRLLHAMNECDPDHRMEFCGLLLHVCDVREPFPNFLVWSDEATFKLNGTVN